MPDPSFVIPLFLQSALLPFGVALAVLIVLRAARLAELAPALAVAAGFLASYGAVYHGQWSWAPRQALDWLPWIVVLGGAGAFAADKVKHVLWRLIIRLALSTGAVGLVASFAVASTGVQKALVAAAVGGVAICAAWTYLARAAQRRSTPPMLLMVISGGAALALMLDASQLIGQLSGALAAALVACIAFNIPRLRSAFSGTATAVAILLLGALLANAYFYAGFAPGYIALLVAGLLADPLVEGFHRLRRRAGGRHAWVPVAVLGAVPVVLTVGLAIRAAQEAGGY